MGSFAEATKKWSGDSAERLKLAHRKIALEAFKEVILMSPVDTGRFRGNWQCAIGPHITYLPPNEDARDPSGAGAIGAVSAMVSALEGGDSIWLVNNLPYAGRLEYGWSDQAPGGMVRLTAQRWQPIVEQIVKEVSGQ